ncbi:hypothetical protein DFO70_1076 [Cytobacillus firmus]|uniref:Uncharacterized protein n=2 Tax=Cytobacillus TaxID=2675230 RepID=A0A366JUR7_CYTFI|nr:MULTISPECIES: hypothetical protein [Cytobacillus]RBP92080.1 hypothetical protein DFO70_1076 [Cytobacillus firmus]TDX42235.1 hypothetical protein DFO72_107404 [Cytobacillus oceanisediminis]
MCFDVGKLQQKGMDTLKEINGKASTLIENTEADGTALQLMMKPLNLVLELMSILMLLLALGFGHHGIIIQLQQTGKQGLK